MARFNMQKQKTLYFMLIANTEALTKLSLITSGRARFKVCDFQASTFSL